MMMRIIETLLLKGKSDPYVLSQEMLLTQKHPDQFVSARVPSTEHWLRVRDRLLVRFRRVTMRVSGVLMGLYCMLVSGFVIALCMELGCCVVGFRCVLVMLRCLLVCVVCHKSPR
jgi:hypothetical protein